MSSIAQVSEAMKHVLTKRAKDLERETGFVERSTARLDGPTFVHTTVFGWMDTPEASYSQLRQVAASLGVAVSSQAVEQRFGAASASLLQEVLQEAVAAVVTSETSAPEVLSRFNGVYVQDGTIISRPAELRDEWRGCGGNTPEAGQSSLRVQVRLDLAHGGMQGPWLQAGRAAEHSGEAHEAPLPQGCLYNVDAGYFSLSEMRAHGQAGCFWVTSAPASTLLIDEHGQCWDLVSFLRAHGGDEIDVEVLLGKRERLPVRLLARRVSAEQAERRRKSANRNKELKVKGVQRPNEKRRAAGSKRQRTHKRTKTSKARLQLLGWTILITNVPPEHLSLDEVVVLARCRWQIEIVQSQMTKARVLTGGGGRDHVTDLYLLVSHHDAVNEQLDQLPFLLEGGLSQPLLDTLAKGFDGLHHSRQFLMAFNVCLELAYLPSNRLQALLQVSAPSLVLL